VSGSIDVPLWLFLALCVLAALAALDLLVRPTARWYVQRKVNTVLQDLGSKLQVELPPFKLTRRQVLIDRLFHDEAVQSAAERLARESGESLLAVRRRVECYAREIVPSFNAYVYFRVGYWLARAIARSLYRVRLGYVDETGLANIERRSTLVFVINHRSNFDYILVAFLAAERAALSYAVGEWARVWPLQALVKAMGAYFVRRDSGDALYRTVLQRYVRMATEAGVTQAVFPEGGLSLDGKLRSPKLGLIDYMVRGFDADGARDLVFIPVGINYDRVLEDRTLLRKLDPAARRRGIAGAGLTTARFAMRNVAQLLTGRWYRYGYACVNFGAPLSMRAWCRERGSAFPSMPDPERHAAVEGLGRELMRRLESVIPVLPVSLVASIMLEAGGQPLSLLELKARTQARTEELERRGARIYVPRKDRDYAIDVGLRMLVLRHLVVEVDGLVRANPEETELLAYYANAIAHLNRPPRGTE
jgi:glycerol-3-phosphate O-acyltransferase